MEWTPFRLFTRESLFNIERRIAEEQAAKEAEKTAKESESESEDDGDETTHDHEPKPNPKLEAGRKLPPSLEDVPQAYIARPLEDLDEFYHNQKARLRKQFACVCVVASLCPWCALIYVCVCESPFINIINKTHKNYKERCHKNFIQCLS